MLIFLFISRTMTYFELSNENSLTLYIITHMKASTKSLKKDIQLTAKADSIEAMIKKAAEAFKKANQ